jgi:CO/xanthine dehydrogenase Mo-binding subunit
MRRTHEYAPSRLERLARELGIDPWDLRAALYMEVDRRSRERAVRHASAHGGLDRKIERAVALGAPLVHQQ